MAGKPTATPGKGNDGARREELLRRVTGQAKPQGQAAATTRRVAPAATPTIPVPPPAQQLPGIRGTPPIPLGRVRVGAAPTMTDEERRTLEAIGWKEGQTIPPNMAALIDEARRQQLASEASELARAAGEFVPPVPEDTPPVTARTVDIEDLSPAARAEILQNMRQANQQLENMRAAQEQAAKTANLPPDVQQAILQANAASTTYRAPTQPAQPAPPQSRSAEPSPTQPVAAPERPERPEPQESTKEPAAAVPGDATAGADGGEQAGSTTLGPTLTECQHCGGDLTKPSIPEPDVTDRLGFLQAILGEKPFLKSYSLFGGSVQMTLRSLTGQELDAIYQQAQYELRTGRINDVAALQERLQRYRFYLQLVSLRSSTFQHVLPDGFTPQTNPHAQTHWEVPDDLPEGCSGLDAVERYIVAHVVKTESLHRTLRNACNQFNRLVAKMEALADNSDFWSAIVAQY